jgi:hypothetical protein
LNEISKQPENHDTENELSLTYQKIDNQISNIDSKTMQIQQHLLPPDQIQLLDV